MFQVHGLQGRMFSGTLEQLRQQRAVAAVAQPRRAALGDARPDPSAVHSAGGHGVGREAALAYGASTTAGARQPLTCVADVMRSPAITVAAGATLREAWQLLAQHGIGQAPVLDSSGTLVGLIGRAELMPAAPLDAPSAPAEQARPVTEVMWTPVPSAAPGTDLRRVAALLLDTGLPGVPVTDEAGGVVGFVSRSDLLRAMTTDPPLDLWG
jgi:CBS domain-containing protein